MTTESTSNPPPPPPSGPISAPPSGPIADDFFSIPKPKNAYRVFIYGEAKQGKTTFAASAPKPVIIDTEGGAGLMPVPSRRVRTWAETRQALTKARELIQAGVFETLVIDSLDWLLEQFKTDVVQGWNKAKPDKQVKEYGAIPYGGGSMILQNRLQGFFTNLDRMYDAYGCNIILTAHAETYNKPNPAGENYLFVGPKGSGSGKAESSIGRLAIQHSQVIG